MKSRSEWAVVLLLRGLLIEAELFTGQKTAITTFLRSCAEHNCWLESTVFVTQFISVDQEHLIGNNYS